MIKFEIGDKTYITKKLTELSIFQYEEIMDRIQNPTSELDDIKFILNRLAGIPFETLELISVQSYLQIDFAQLLTAETDKNPIQKKYLNFDLPEYNKISFGKFIDLEYFIIQDKPMVNVISRLLMPEKYDFETIHKQVEENLNILDALTIFDTYNSWRADLFKKYDSLFSAPPEPEEEEIFEEEKEEEEEEEKENSAYQWLDIANNLAGHILKLDAVLDKTILEVMNWLSYEHNKAEKEKEALEAQKNKS